jgi:hypothetical protein
MDLAVALPAEGDEIFFSIVTQPASWRNVVNFQSGACTAGLAPPAITFQD